MLSVAEEPELLIRFSQYLWIHQNFRKWGSL